jgi:plastocyanin
MSSAKRAGASLVLAVMLVVDLGGAAQASPVIRGLGVRWSPSTVTVGSGSSVRWRGVAGLHNVVSYSRNWSFEKALPEGAVVGKRFRSSGRYRFRCTFHSSMSGNTCTGMCGSVVVTA